MNTPLKAIVVGTGFGCRIQVPALRGAGFEVSALVGNDPERTAQRAAANGIPRSLTNLDTAIDMTGATLVVISTPPHTHGPLALRALAGGCHVLCEKPFARDCTEAQAILYAAEAAGKYHVLGNEFRFIPQRAAIARAIAEGMIGEPRFATLVQVLGFLSAFDEEFSDWWFDPAQGGGWLGTSGSHAIDQIRSWLGEFESVSGMLSNISTTRGPVDDSFSVRFRLVSGLEGVLQQTGASAGPLTEITQVSGTKGRIWLDGQVVRIADAEGERELPIPADLELPPAPPLGEDPRQAKLGWKIMGQIEISPYTQLCRNLRAAILGEAPPSLVKAASFVDGVANMAVIDAIRTSSKNGGSVERISTQ